MKKKTLWVVRRPDGYMEKCNGKRCPAPSAPDGTYRLGFSLSRRVWFFRYDMWYFGYLPMGKPVKFELRRVK